ncbi:MAG: DUF2334 domain-containing protein [Acidimicrobiales bacterium]
MSASAKSSRSNGSPVAMLMLVAAVVLAVLFGRAAFAQPLPGRAAVPVGSPFSTVREPLPSGRTVAAPDLEVLVAWDAADDNATAELYAVMAGNLAGNVAQVRYLDAAYVTADDVAASDLAIYVNSDPKAPVSVALVRSIANGHPTLWLGDNLDQIEALAPDFFDSLGWASTAAVAAPSAVRYKNVDLPRDARAGDLVGLEVGAATEVLATVSSADGSEMPYAVVRDNLTWLAEVPFSYTTEADRGLVLADRILAVADPDRPERHRAMVRLEDVGPWADPEALVDIADALAERGVPFSVAVYPVWMDPLGHYDNGTGIRLADRPEVVEALQHIEASGGTLLMHGITHQLGEAPNPYDGVSGEDFEFYVTHIDANDDVVYDGPPAQADEAWITDRIAWGFAEFAAAGLDAPTIFEFPHYAAHWVGYQTIADAFDARYERTMYFGGLLSGQPLSSVHDDQWLPFPVVDFYGELVLPENMGNYIEVGYNNNDSRSAADLIDNAERVAVVSDSVSSMFFHPYLDPAPLLEVVDTLIARGFEFVGPHDLIQEFGR